MLVSEAMSTEVLTIGPTHTLRDAASRMSARKVGAAVVMDGDQDQPGILTERDILDAVGQGQDVDTEKVHDHLTADIVVAAPDWPLTKAAAAMVSGGFRHLVVCQGREVVGMLSVRDIVRVSASETVS
ncbi:MAG TPA: CBS domain-containing protein [Mycobacteriales bacterium]|nr:CBS domain-containing protein [Mycobacteriales bacterium]